MRQKRDQKKKGTSLLISHPPPTCHSWLLPSPLLSYPQRSPNSKIWKGFFETLSRFPDWLIDTMQTTAMPSGQRDLGDKSLSPSPPPHNLNSYIKYLNIIKTFNSTRTRGAKTDLKADRPASVSNTIYEKPGKSSVPFQPEKFTIT